TVAQIAIVATTSTPGIVRNSKKRPASPSHNSSSGGGYGSSKKKKVCASSFAQGLLANYTDPQSKLRFSTIKELPSDVVTGYLALRRATSIIPGAQEVEVKCKALLKTDPGLVILFHGNKLVLLSI
uniref:Uncharacterized protein n=1 Tax=Cebus imitator TaxID=2715852 RepID=A0A2K5RGV7_CEBIM